MQSSNLSMSELLALYWLIFRFLFLKCFLDYVIPKCKKLYICAFLIIRIYILYLQSDVNLGISIVK